MSRGPYTFKQTDVVRALKAADAAGREVAGFKIDRAGDIVVIFGKPPAATASGNEWDDLISASIRPQIP
jgi:hypothetical protein